MRFEDHEFHCTVIDVVQCDDCEKKFCRGCDNESKTDFDEGVRRCGLCVALDKQWKKRAKK